MDKLLFFEKKKSIRKRRTKKKNCECAWQMESSGAAWTLNGPKESKMNQSPRHHPPSYDSWIHWPIKPLAPFQFTKIPLLCPILESFDAHSIFDIQGHNSKFKSNRFIAPSMPHNHEKWKAHKYQQNDQTPKSKPGYFSAVIEFQWLQWAGRFSLAVTGNAWVSVFTSPPSFFIYLFF